MKKLLAIIAFVCASPVFGSDRIALPAEGLSSAESIGTCESQVANSKGFKKNVGKTDRGYTQINAGSDSFVYVFATSAEPAYPAMMKITMHPMFDPRNPKESDIEFHGSYAGKEEDYLAWSKRVLFDFGRGFASGVMKKK